MWKVIVEYMELTGLSQTALAERIGVDQGQFNHWLNLRRCPNIQNLKKMSAATGISLERLAEEL